MSRVVRPGKGGSVIDVITETRSMESKVFDLSKKSYRTKAGALKRSQVARSFRRALRQGAKHEKDLQKAGIKNVKTGKPIKETVVAKLRGLKEGSNEAAEVLKIGREESAKLGQGIKVGVLKENVSQVAKTGEEALKTAAETTGKEAIQEATKETATQLGKTAGEEALKVVPKTAAKEALQEATKVGVKTAAKTAGKTILKFIPFIGIPIAIYEVQKEIRAGNYGAAVLAGVEGIPVVGDVVGAGHLGYAIGTPIGNWTASLW